MTSEEEISSFVSKKNDIISAKSDLEMHGDHLAFGTELGAKLKKLRVERDEAMKKADGADSKVKNLEARIADHEEEIQSVKERSSYLEAQLRTVGVQLEEHKSVVKGREETAIQKAERARQLLEEIQQIEKEMEKDEIEFVTTMETSVQPGSEEFTSMSETSSHTSSVLTHT